MATAGKNMEIALRVRADMEQAVQQLKSMRSELDAMRAASRAASDKVGAGSKGVNQLGSATNAAAKATQAQTQANNGATAADKQRTTSVKGATDALKAHVAAVVQQSAQLKDMSGGLTSVLPTASKATLGLINPITLAIGAVVALGVAWYKGAKEGEAFAAAIIMNGNAAGTTTGQLSSTAQAVGRVTGSYGLAIEATRQLAATGRVANAQLALAAQASVGMAQVGAAAVGDMTAKFAELGKSPVEASRKFNEQYRYLTASIYEQIKALDEQGRKEEAAALAQRTFAQAMVDRSNEVKVELNALGKAFRWVSEQAGGMWNAVANIGRTTPLEEEIAETRKEYDALLKAANNSAKIASFFGIEGVDTTFRERQKVFAKLMDLQKQSDAKERKATNDRQRAQDAEASVAAIDKVTAANHAARDNQEKLNAALEDYHKQLEVIRKTTPNSVLLKPETIAKTEAYIREQFKDKGGNRVNPVDTAFQAQLQQLMQARAAAEQQLANAQANVASTQEQATTKLDAWLNSNKNALKLDATRIAQLRSLAQQTDAAVAATKALQDARARADRITSGMASVDTALAQATGRTVDAEMARITERYRKLREDLTTEGNKEGLLKLDKLIDIETAKAQLQELQRQVEQIFGNQSRQEQTLQLSVTAGMTSELDAKRQILEMNSRTAEQIAALLPRMQELAAITGDPSMAAGLADMALRVQGLRTQANDLKNTFSDAFNNSFANALESLADGTASLGDAVRGFMSDLTRAMAQWASQQLAIRATSSIMGLFGAGGDAATAAAGAARAAVYADGGWTGPGSKYKPAGIVHAEEFVNRREVVRQPGALAFLTRFNQIGMAALKDWQGYASGGFVVDGAHSGVPNSSNFQPAPINLGGSTTVDNKLQLNLIDDPDRIAAMAFKSRQGQEAFTVMLSNNPGKFRQLLGV